MQRIEKSIEVDVPVRTAYNQWTQFESFPNFMDNVEAVQQLDDKRLHWVAKVAGRRKEWDAEIVEQVPDEVVSWRSTSGAIHSGSATFKPVDAAKTKVTLIMTVEPEDALEKLAAQPVLSARVKADLERFKRFMEDRQSETGAWRGEIRDGEVTRTDPIADAPEKRFTTGDGRQY